MIPDPHRFQLAFLEALLRSPIFVASCDAATDLIPKCEVGGRMVGQLIRSLELDGLIEKVSTTDSKARAS
jgi:hypothetical protein